MVKIRFNRSSRASIDRDATSLTNVQPKGSRPAGEYKSNGDYGTRDSDAANKTDSDSKKPPSKISVKVSTKKTSNRRKHPALRLFNFSSLTSSPSSSHSKNTEHQSSSSSTSAASNPQKASILSTDSSSGSTSKETRLKSDDRVEKRESSRMFSSIRSDTHPTTTIKGNAKKPVITTNSSNKQVISMALPPYEIAVTDIDGQPYVECPLCVILVDYNTTPDLKTCSHRTCLDCMQRYLKTEINHSRLKITCPICSEPLHQRVIREVLQDDKFYFKYESFMLRKVLAAEPDARWCPAPDCGYAVLATGCASCPRIVCGREGCNTEFCYHCKQEWHPNQTCSAASIQRNKRSGFVLSPLNINDLVVADDTIDSGSIERGVTMEDDNIIKSDITKEGHSRASQQGRGATSGSVNSSTLRTEDIKECPVCSSRIIKMNDGSCNHMTCSICETDFCWLCMKEISDLHYFSPSGCTFWGKKPWSRKKKLLWRLGMLVGAPICIVFIAGIAVPAIVIGIPVWAARKLHTRLEKKEFSSYRKNAIITGGVLLSFIVSPIISAMALAVGIPILLGYVYGVVPLSLCRSSGGCLSSNSSVGDLTFASNHATAAATSVMSQARDQLQRSQLEAAHHEFKRQQFKSEQQELRSRANKLQPKSLSTGDQATSSSGPYSAIVGALDTGANGRLDLGNSNQGGGSIGEPSMYMSNISLETNSIGNVTSIVERCSRNSACGPAACELGAGGCEDRESASNVALSGSILSHKTDDAQSTRALAGSIVSKESSGGYTLIPAEVHVTTIQHQQDTNNAVNTT